MKLSHGLRQVVLSLCLIFLVLFAFDQTAITQPSINSDGAKIFETNCSGCHVNGGNIIRRGKTLKQKALERNGYDSLETVIDIVTMGKNNMSAFGDRLTTAEIETVANYVLEQAKNDWKLPK